MGIFGTESEPSRTAAGSGTAAETTGTISAGVGRSESRAKARKRSGVRVAGAKKIRSKELPAFSRQLSAMLLAGMPLIQALNALEDHTNDRNFKAVVAGLRGQLEAGASFSEALARYPSVFDELYVNMIRAGESGGQLGETEARLAGFLEDSARLIRKVKSAMMYPVIVLCIALAIAAAMILFVVPVFGEMFADFGAALPGPTQFLIDLSDKMRQYGLFIAVAVVLLIVGFKKWKQTPSGAYRFSLFALKFPVLGELSQKVATSRFSRTFAQLLRSGVPILKAMEISSGATGNKVFEVVILDSRNTVERGDPLSSALGKSKCFPRLLVHMMAAGEKTGKIDEMMESIAIFYDDEVMTMLDGLTALIEPLLMIFLGIIIGGIVISMFLPIFRMVEVVG